MNKTVQKNIFRILIRIFFFKKVFKIEFESKKVFECNTKLLSAGLSRWTNNRK